MRRQIVTTLTVLFFLSVAFMPTATRAALQRVGPNVPANGYPAWYQDSTGLVLDLCTPQSQGELDNGWCLILNQDVPAGIAPETFPTNFADEHFWWAGDAGFALPDFVDPVTGFPTANRARLVLGLEAAFLSGPAIPGDQMSFGRVRVVMPSVPVSGDYTVYHPYGKWVFPGLVAGDRLFYTEDIGVNCPAGQFDCALISNVGPFLLPSTVPGGAELPPIPLLQPGQDPFYDALLPAPTPYPGNPLTETPKYIADPARIGPVTGSPLPAFVSAVDGLTYNHNVFRIEVVPADGTLPFVLGETSSFALMGRIFEGTIPGKVHVDRASYTVPVAASATNGKLDVFVTAYSAMPARLPQGVPPVAGAPALVFYDEPCAADPLTGAITGPPVGEPTHQMFDSGSNYWGQSPPCELDPITGLVIVPPAVCVAQTNAIGPGGQQVSAYYSAPVIDEVTVTQANYDYGTTDLSVAASSSDLIDPPTLLLTDFGQLTAGVWTSTALPPPATVQVSSTARRPLAFGNKGGIGEMQVNMGVGAFAAPSVPVAANDLATTLEDTPLAAIDVLVNDTYLAAPIVFGAGVTVTIVNPPRLGTAAVNADGTVSYTPGPDRFGSDGFAYQVSVLDAAGLPVLSNIAGISVIIAGVNDLPVANTDASGTIVNFPVAINVLANDADPDGPTDLVGVANLTQPTPATASVSAVGGVVTFNATAPGLYTFTYQALDGSGAVSALAAIVTVNVAASETVTIAQPVEFRSDQARWAISGTDSPAAGQVLTITYADGPNAGFVLGTATVDALGNWLYDARGVTGLFNPTIAQATQIRVTGPAGGVATTFITVR